MDAFAMGSPTAERNLRPADITEVFGLPVTTPVRTAWDLGRVRWHDTALSGLDAMLRVPGFPREEFLAGVERFRRQRWVTTLRTLAPLADPRAASPGESVLRLRWLDCGLPKPVLQHEVWDGDLLIAILDIASPDIGYAAEYDGAEWHSSPEQISHDRRRREAVSRRDFVIDAFTKANVFGQHRDCEFTLVAGAERARAQRRSHLTR